MDNELPWFRRAIVGMEVGPTGAQGGIDPEDSEFAARFSGTEIVARCLEANAEYLVLWAKDNEFAYYDSQIAPKCPGLGARDALREAVEAARPHDLPIIAYCEVQYPGYLLRTRPQYRMRALDGREIPERVCYNSGYQDHVRRLADEMLAYGIAGFHFDMVDQGFGPPYGCACAACRALFEQEYGRALPDAARWDADWERLLEFRYNSSARFQQELREYVRQQNPAATVDFNYHGSPPFSWEVGQRPVQHAHIGDFATGECGLWAFGALHGSLATRFLAATKPGAVTQMVMQRGARSYHDMTTRPLADLRWEAFTLLSLGAQVTIVDKTPYDGALDPIAYQRIGAVFAEARRKREQFGQPQVAEVGLYYSARSRDWFGRENAAAYQQAFTGAHRALTYAHIPTGVILDENVSAESLRAFPVVLLPHTAILTEREVKLLRDYAEAGGSLLLTGHSGLYDRYGEPAQENALGALIGAAFVERLPDLDNHVSLPAEAEAELFLRDIPADWPFLVYGPAAVYRPTSAQSVGILYRPHRTRQQRKGKSGYTLPLSADTPVGPAILVNTVGRGRVVTVACAPDAAFASEYRTTETRLLLRNLVRFLNPAPPVEVEAPLHVETVLTDDTTARCLRIHLIGYLAPPACSGPKHSSPAPPSLIEEAPLYRVRVTLRRPFARVEALNPATRITWQADRIEAVIEDIHETLIVHY